MCRTTLAPDATGGDGGKLVTVVTSDLKGSTALGETLDPESLREVLNRYFAVMRVVFESHGGSIEKIIGDAIVAVFGLPFRHEDDPIRAVEAAAETQRALATLNDELDMLWGVRLVNRTGIATGIVHFGRDAEGQHVLIGNTIDESTAMEQNAPALEVLMAASTYAEVVDVVEAEDLGPRSPKGSDLQIQSHRLVAVRSRTAVEDVAPPEPTPGTRACQVCGEESPERYRYCISCGASASTAMARDSRKTVTIVFANPKPHTESGLPLEPAAFTDVMTRYFQAMKVALERHGGTVEKFIGDAVMAVFGLPVRHEDDALRAVRAAADMQAALPALNEAFGVEYGVQLLNHIGVNTGEVIATGDASTGQRLVTGDAVNTAARLEQAAGAAEIILGELTHRLTRSEIQVDVIPPLVLKGKAEPVPAYRFVAVGARADDGGEAATQFVGREAEMARLSEALLDAVGQRRARLITIVGDAGVGKSRLIREFASTATHEAGLVRGRCLPYGDGITFWPIAEVVRSAAGIADDDAPEIARDRILRLLRERGAADAAAIADRVSAAIGLSPATFQIAELFWATRRLLETMARERPLVVIIDDVHNAAPTFLDLLDHVIEAATEAPILLLCSARYELLRTHASWAEAQADERIELTPLSTADADTIIDQLLVGLDDRIRQRIARAAEGNPLYVEQLVSMLVETGAIRREGDGWSAALDADVAVPPTIQALVAARLDALEPDERATVEPAAVIGLSFPVDALAELVPTDIHDQLPGQLGSLDAKQFVRRVGDVERTYRFGHGVIRDTTYGSMLKRTRVALHERFVTWAERVNRERGRETEFEEILGYHLEQSYRYRLELGPLDDEGREVGRRAAAKLASAGARALARTDMPAAADLLGRAVRLLPNDDPTRVELLSDLAEAQMELGEFEPSAGSVAAAVVAAAQLGDPRLSALAQLHRVALGVRAPEVASPEGDPERSIDDAIAVLEAAGDEAGLARAWRVWAMLRGRAGRYDDVAEAAERIIDHATRASEERLVARGISIYANNAVLGSRPVGEISARMETLLERARGDRKAAANMSLGLAQLQAMQGSIDRARELYRRGQALLDDLGPSISAATTSIASSRVELLAGDLDRAEAELRRDDAMLARLSETFYRSWIVGVLARVVLMRGDLAEAGQLLEQADSLADPDDVDTQVLLAGVRARLLSPAGRIDEAVAAGRYAVERSRETADPVLQADVLVDLSEALAAAGRYDDARQSLLAAVHQYEAKGDVVSAGRFRKRLGELSASSSVQK
jgi:class 3 adenylate cyclase/tetratricopeptide (TPR) repeat protein